MICGKNIGANFRTSNGLDGPIRITLNSHFQGAQQVRPDLISDSDPD